MPVATRKKKRAVLGKSIVRTEERRASVLKQRLRLSKRRVCRSALRQGVSVLARCDSKSIVRLSHLVARVSERRATRTELRGTNDRLAERRSEDAERRSSFLHPRNTLRTENDRLAQRRSKDRETRFTFLRRRKTLREANDRLAERRSEDAESHSSFLHPRKTLREANDRLAGALSLNLAVLSLFPGRRSSLLAYRSWLPACLFLVPARRSKLLACRCYCLTPVFHAVRIFRPQAADWYPVPPAPSPFPPLGSERARTPQSCLFLLIQG